MDVHLDRRVLEDVTAFAAAFGIDLYAWQREAFGTVCRREAGRFVYRLAGVSVPRGNGKSYAAAVVGLWRLLCGPPPQDVLGCALDTDGAKVVLGHARSIVRASDTLSDAIVVTANGLEVPATGSRWTIASREHQASRGRHPTVVLYDEVGWARDDELFSSLLAGQASVTDPLCLVVSTVGRRQSGPLWLTKQLAEGGDEHVGWWYSSENLSRAVTGDFLERQRGILLPAAFAREHQNQWVDAADAFTSQAEVDAAMGHGWTQQHQAQLNQRYVAFIDLGLIHDATVLCVGHEDAGIVYVDVLSTFQGSRATPVQLAAVEDAITDLAERFPMRVIRVESWQGAASAQRLERLGLPVEIAVPTKSGLARTVDLTNETVRVLRTHVVRRREEKLRRGWHALPRPLFCSMAGTYADPADVRRAFRKVCKAASLMDATGKRAAFTPHGLRHTYASLLLQDGAADVYYVQRMLGHADIALTVGTYGSHHQPGRRQNLDALDPRPRQRRRRRDGVQPKCNHAARLLS